MQIHLSDAFLVAIASSITELAKALGFPRKYLPLVSLGSGVLTALLFYAADVFPLARAAIQAILVGAVAGFTASGLYDSLTGPTSPDPPWYPQTPQAPTVPTPST